jgi:flagellar assembly factor FliW
MTLPAESPTEVARVTIPTRLFGPLSVPVDSWITFPDGLLGFGGERRFVLLPAAPAGLYWMQDIQHSALAFLVADPVLFFPEYAPLLPPRDDDAPREAVGIVTLGERDDDSCTMNLQAPVLIDFTARLGEQVIAEGATYHTRHPVDLRAFLASMK